jgi:MYXO-CTERM domain-containing protein
MILLLVPGALAATWTVDAGGGADFRTIGDAIAGAQSGDTIEIAGGTYNECLDPDGRSLTLRGEGESTAIDGSGCSFAFVVDGGESLTLEDLSFTGIGSRGIYAAYSTVSLVRVRAAEIGNSSAYGGVIEAYTSTISLTDCSFEDNTGAYGGVAYLAWYTSYTDLGSTYRGNLADGDGGAIYTAAYDVLSLDGVQFENNSASGGGGALLLAFTSDVAVRDSSFEGNEAGGSGGAAYLYAVDPTALFADTRFDANTAGAYGGALELEWYAAVEVDGCTFDGNTAASGGGAIYTYVLDSLDLQSSSFCANQSPTGGAVGVVWTGPDTVRNSVFAENQADNGGAIYRYASGSGTIENNTFVGNDATGWGGAYYASWASPARFANNIVAGSTDSAGIYADDAADLAGSEMGWNGWSDNGPVNGAGYFSVEADTDGNVIGDPLFVAWSDNGGCSDDDLRLSGTSPMRDMGDPKVLDPDGGRSDMGAWGGPGAPIEDQDGDGFDTTSDCDDTTSGSNPGGTEACDGLDNDCDGTVDGSNAADQPTWYNDLDGDGYGDSSTGTTSCEAPAGSVALPGDCDDQNPYQSPGAEDVCEDGFDQDCSGEDAECKRSCGCGVGGGGQPAAGWFVALALLAGVGQSRRRS